MAKKKTKKKTSAKHTMSTESKVAVGVGLTAASVAAIGGYFLYGSKNAAKNRKKAKSWMLKAKAEVLETIEDMQDITEEEYHRLVDAVADGYKRARTLSTAELAAFTSEMKQHWKEIERSGTAKKITDRARKFATRTKKAAKKKGAKKTAKRAKKTAKKTTKKSTKKKAKRTKR